MEEIKLTKKQGRLRKQQKKKVAKFSGTLGGQISRTKVSKGYLKLKKK
jgi:hypothetical protein